MPGRKRANTGSFVTLSFEAWFSPAFSFLPDILIFGDDIRKTSWEVTAAEPEQGRPKKTLRRKQGKRFLKLLSGMLRMQIL